MRSIGISRVNSTGNVNPYSQIYRGEDTKEDKKTEKKMGGVWPEAKNGQ